MFCFVAVEYLDFVAVLQVYATVAAFGWNEEFNMESEVAVFFFGDEVGSPISTASGCGVVCHHDGAFVDGVVEDFPFDGK